MFFRLRRLLVLGWLAFLLLLWLVACRDGAPDLVSTELNLYTFAAYVPADLLSDFSAQTGVALRQETYESNEEMLEGLAARPGYYDVIIPSDYAVEILINQRALLPLDLGRIPGYNNIARSFLNPYFDPGGTTGGRRPVLPNQKYSLPYQWGTTGIAYDATRVSAPITRWSDLWRPELAGHLVVLDDAREMLGLSLLTLGYDKNSVKAAELGAARDHLLRLAPGVIAIDSATPEEYLLSGEAWVAVVYNGNAALAARQNPNIVYVLPEEGAGIWFDNLAISADAPHPDAAYALIAFLLEPANSARITQEFPYSNPNDAALAYLREHDLAGYSAYMDSAATNPSPEVLAGARLVKNVGDATAALYDDYWADVKAAAP